MFACMNKPYSGLVRIPMRWPRNRRSKKRRVRTILWVAALLGWVFLAVGTANAQAIPAGRGSESNCPCLGGAWAEIGNYSPAEKTVLFSAYAEQGVSVYRAGSFSITPYVSLAVGSDTAGVDWSNKIGSTVGVRLTKNFRHGIISVGTAYAAEDRFRSGMFKSSMTNYASYWFGWGNYLLGNRFPGNSWGIVGNYTPVEHGNYILASYAQQGIVVARTRRTALVPFIEGAFNRDTKGFDWNNRVIYGSGVKLARPSKAALIEVGVSFLRETRFNSSTTYNGFTVFVKLWTGWQRGK